MIRYVESFQQACEVAATEDDGVIDRRERKQLDQIKKAVDRFKRDLERIR
ncbi:MAG: hypothetical protein IJG49_00620 [Erysipelotrichaceae bacterium]|nr:hypothetical protein [Erysipelotrichaceae bacterium]